jgi:AcrR family transcriptional regulator
MGVLTRKQREIRARDGLILEEARRLLIQDGYHGLTMARIAEKIGCAKGTVYQHYPCKEEVIIAVAAESTERQREFIERAATFRGRPRERMVAVAVATELFSLLYREDARIFQIVSGEAITQKASAEALRCMTRAGLATVNAMLGIVRDGIAQGDLMLPEGHRPEDLVYHFWLLGEGGKSASSSWLPPAELGIDAPFLAIVKTGQVLGDGYGWRPLSNEWDYEETSRRIQREVFPDECRRVYGRVRESDDAAN